MARQGTGFNASKAGSNPVTKAFATSNTVMTNKGPREKIQDTRAPGQKNVITGEHLDGSAGRKAILRKAEKEVKAKNGGLV